MNSIIKKFSEDVDKLVVEIDTTLRMEKELRSVGTPVQGGYTLNIAQLAAASPRSNRKQSRGSPNPKSSASGRVRNAVRHVGMRRAISASASATGKVMGKAENDHHLQIVKKS